MRMEGDFYHDGSEREKGRTVRSLRVKRLKWDGAVSVVLIL